MADWRMDDVLAVLVLGCRVCVGGWVGIGVQGVGRLLWAGERFCISVSRSIVVAGSCQRRTVPGS